MRSERMATEPCLPDRQMDEPGDRRPVTVVRSRSRKALAMTSATSDELMSHAAVTGGEPLTASTCERPKRAVRRAIHIG